MGLLADFNAYLRKRHVENVQNIRMKLLRDINRMARKEDFYKTDNDISTNLWILKNHKEAIDRAITKHWGLLVKHCSIEEIEKIKKQLGDQAELWHEFRTKGLHMPLERLNKLMVLEENAAGSGDGYEKLKAMIAQLAEQGTRVPLKERETCHTSGEKVQGKVAQVKVPERNSVVR